MYCRKLLRDFAAAPTARADVEIFGSETYSTASVQVNNDCCIRTALGNPGESETQSRGSASGDRGGGRSSPRPMVKPRTR
jgi:hypothetical protein